MEKRNRGVGRVACNDLDNGEIDAVVVEIESSANEE